MNETEIRADERAKCDAEIAQLKELVREAKEMLEKPYDHNFVFSKWLAKAENLMNLCGEINDK